MKVQDPTQKVYVLLQAAVARLELKDFSLKVEQAELVESGLRVLSALKELSIAIGHGSILEHTILLDRALRLRMWEVGYGSVFYQCAGLLAATRNGLIMRGVRTLRDVLDGCCSTVSKLQGVLDCNAHEGRQILQLAKTLHQSTMAVEAAVIAMGGSLVINIRSLHWSTDSAPHSSSNSSEASPSFQLIAYCALSSELLCYRKVDLVGGAASYTVPLKASSGIGGIEDIRCSLLSNYVGIDAYQLETQHAPVSSKVTPSAAAASSSSTGSTIEAPRKSQQLQQQKKRQSSAHPTAAAAAGRKVDASVAVGRRDKQASSSSSSSMMKQCTLDRDAFGGGRAVTAAVASPSTAAALLSLRCEGYSDQLHHHHPTAAASASKPSTSSAPVSGTRHSGPAAGFEHYRYYEGDQPQDQYQQDLHYSMDADFSTPTARRAAVYAADSQLSDHRICKVEPQQQQQQQRTTPVPTTTRGQLYPAAAAIVSGDLQAIRRKALELNLDQVQVKRLRSNTHRQQQQSPQQQQQYGFSSPYESRPDQLPRSSAAAALPYTAAGLQHRYSPTMASQQLFSTRRNINQPSSSSSSFFDDDHGNGIDDDSNFFAESSTIGCHHCPDEEQREGGGEAGGGQLIAMRRVGKESTSPAAAEADDEDCIGGAGMSYRPMTMDSCRAVSSSSSTTGYRDYSEHRASSDTNGLNHRSNHYDRPTSHDYHHDRPTCHDYRDDSSSGISRHSERGLFSEDAATSHDYRGGSEDAADRIIDPHTAAHASPQQLDSTFDDLFF